MLLSISKITGARNIFIQIFLKCELKVQYIGKGLKVTKASLLQQKTLQLHILCSVKGSHFLITVKDNLQK